MNQSFQHTTNSQPIDQSSNLTSGGGSASKQYKTNQFLFVDNTNNTQSTPTKNKPHSNHQHKITNDNYPQQQQPLQKQQKQNPIQHFHQQQLPKKLVEEKTSKLQESLLKQLKKNMKLIQDLQGLNIQGGSQQQYGVVSGNHNYNIQINQGEQQSFRLQIPINEQINNQTKGFMHKRGLSQGQGLLSTGYGRRQLFQNDNLQNSATNNNQQPDVLNVQKKEIAITSRQKQIGEKFKFYRNKQLGQFCMPKLEQETSKNYFSAERLQEKGINPEELQMLQRLTQASLQFMPNSATVSYRQLQDIQSIQHLNRSLHDFKGMVGQKKIDRKLNLISSSPEQNQLNNSQPFFPSSQIQRQRNTLQRLNKLKQNNMKFIETDLNHSVMSPLQYSTNQNNNQQSPQNAVINSGEGQPLFKYSQNYFSSSGAFDLSKNSLLKIGENGIKNKQDQVKMAKYYKKLMNMTTRNMNHVFSEYLEKVKEEDKHQQFQKSPKLKNLTQSLNLKQMPYSPPGSYNAQAIKRGVKPHNKNYASFSNPVSPKLNNVNPDQNEDNLNNSTQIGSIQNQKDRISSSTYDMFSHSRELNTLKQRNRLRSLFEYHQQKNNRDVLNKFLRRSDWEQKPNRMEQFKKQIMNQYDGQYDYSVLLSLSQPKFEKMSYKNVEEQFQKLETQDDSSSQD
eukprot:403337904